MKFLTIPFMISFLAVMLSSCNKQDSKKAKQEDLNIAKLEVQNSQELIGVFSQNDYLIERVKETRTCPRIFVINIPNSLQTITVQKRKGLFIRMILPNVLKANEEISSARKGLIDIISKIKKHISITTNDSVLISRLALLYKTNPGDLNELQLRIDIIPPSLAIAQAIDESGWGTSHFATEGNCLFGQHTSLHGNGKYIPVKGSTVQMAAFETILEATKGYMHNLNTTKAYHDLRKQRAVMRNSNEQISGNKLADSESHYSERGEAYVKMIQGFIKSNHLSDLDYVKLATHDQEFSIFIKQ